jgi:hypothetical protein
MENKTKIAHADPIGSHTPTPWFNPVECPTLVSSVSHGMVTQCDVEDAAFIVRAVNTHEEMLHMLKVALTFFDPSKPIAESLRRIIATGEGK